MLKLLKFLIVIAQSQSSISLTKVNNRIIAKQGKRILLVNNYRLTCFVSINLGCRSVIVDSSVFDCKDVNAQIRGGYDKNNCASR